MRPQVYGNMLLSLSNAHNAVGDRPIITPLENRKLRRLYAAAQRGWLQVATAEGVELGQFTAVKPAWMPTILSLPNWLFLRLAKAMLDIDPHARSSMWEDISMARKTDIEFLTEAVVKRAEKLGLDTQVHRKLSALIHSLERGDTVTLQQLY